MMGRLSRRQEREREQRDELLSAYLDDQLSAAGRARLEAQLATDPTLQAELDALRRTVALVRDLPSVPVPRNFILPRTAAIRPRPVPASSPLYPSRLRGGRKEGWAAPLLTAATAVVSFLFVVVLARDLLLSGVSRQALAPAVPMEEPRIEMVVEVEAEMEAEAPQAAPAPSPAGEEAPVEVQVEKVVEAAIPTPTPAPLEAEYTATAEAEHYAMEEPESIEATVATAGGGPGEETATPTPMPSPPVVEEAVTARPTPETDSGVPAEEPAAPAPAVSTVVVEEPVAEPTTRAMATAVPEADVSATEPVPTEVGEGIPWAAEEGKIEAAEDRQGAPEGEVGALATISPWRVLEGVLGLTALGLALATVWAWRARRR